MLWGSFNSILPLHFELSWSLDKGLGSSNAIGSLPSCRRGGKKSTPNWVPRGEFKKQEGFTDERLRIYKCCSRLFWQRVWEIKLLKSTVTSSLLNSLIWKSFCQSNAVCACECIIKGQVEFCFNGLSYFFGCLSGEEKPCGLHINFTLHLGY